MVAVGVDERGLVAGCAAVAGGLLHAGVPLDGVQGDIEAAGAFEQADALAEQMVDLLPALAGGLLKHAPGRTGFTAVAQQAVWERPSARTLPHRLLHRCHMSLTCTASGRAWRIASP